LSEAATASVRTNIVFTAKGSSKGYLRIIRVMSGFERGTR